jgi:hypothetical protein
MKGLLKLLKFSATTVQQSGSIKKYFFEFPKLPQSVSQVHSLRPPRLAAYMNRPNCQRQQGEHPADHVQGFVPHAQTDEPHHANTAEQSQK